MQYNELTRDSFLNQAQKGDSSWIWYLLTSLAVIIAHVIGQVPILLLIGIKTAQGYISNDQVLEFSETADFSLVGVDKNMGLFLLLLGFVASMIAFYFCVKYLHKRSFLSLINALDRIRWNKVWFGFFFWFLITALGEFVVYLMGPDNYSFSFNIAQFLPLLLIALLILPIQTTFEEVFVRGYLMQGVSLITRYRWIPIVVSSAIFASLHLANPEVAKFGFGVMVCYYFGVGLFLAIITIMDEGLELALGIHAATNIYGAAFVTFTGSALQTDAVFQVELVNAELMLVFFLFSAVIFLIFAQRKFKWDSLSKVWGKTEVLHEIAITDQIAEN